MFCIWPLKSKLPSNTYTRIIKRKILIKTMEIKKMFCEIKKLIAQNKTSIEIYVWEIFLQR